MPVLSVVLFLSVILAGSLPALSRTCCYPATFQPSPPYASSGCVCSVLDEDLSFSCRVSSDGSISCSSSSSSEDSPIPSEFSCSSFPCFPDFPVGGSDSGSACQSVYGLIETFQGVKEGFLKVFIGSSFAFGLLGGAYAVLRVVF
jgi:hypothetical protein